MVQDSGGRVARAWIEPLPWARTTIGRERNCSGVRKSGGVRRRTDNATAIPATPNWLR